MKILVFILAVSLLFIDILFDENLSLFFVFYVLV